MNSREKIQEKIEVLFREAEKTAQDGMIMVSTAQMTADVARALEKALLKMTDAECDEMVGKWKTNEIQVKQTMN